MRFFDRLSNGWTIAMNSFKVLKENKQLIIFPILSGMAILLIMASFFTVFLAAAGWDVDNMGSDDNVTPANVLLVFAFYVVNYFIVIFFNVALVHCTRLYFHGEEVTIRKGIQFAISRIGAIFSWAFVAATAGLILRAIQENSGTVGKIITGIIGVVWSIATFFVVPIIAYENVGPFDAIKRSSSLMKEKWGESLAANFSFGLIQFLGVLLVGLPLYFIGALISPIAGIALAIVGVFSIIAIISATQTIFISAVYHNVTGDPVKHFNQQMVDQLFDRK